MAKAWNISFKTLYSGQIMLPIQLIIPNYLVTLSHWRSITVSLETSPLYLLICLLMSINHKKCIKNSMENMHTDVRVDRVKQVKLELPWMELYCDKCWKQWQFLLKMSRCSGLTMKVNKTIIIPLVLVGFKISYIQLGAKHLSGHLPSHIQCVLME